MSEWLSSWVSVGKYYSLLRNGINVPSRQHFFKCKKNFSPICHPKAKVEKFCFHQLLGNWLAASGQRQLLNGIWLFVQKSYDFSKMGSGDASWRNDSDFKELSFGKNLHCHPLKGIWDTIVMVTFCQKVSVLVPVTELHSNILLWENYHYKCARKYIYIIFFLLKINGFNKER